MEPPVEPDHLQTEKDEHRLLSQTRLLTLRCLTAPGVKQLTAEAVPKNGEKHPFCRRWTF